MSTADSSTVPRPPPPAADAVSGPGLQQQRVLRRAVPRNVNGRMQYMTAAAGARPQMVRPPGTSPLLMRAPPPPVPQRVKILRTLKDATLFAAAIFIIFFANSRFGLVGACLVGTILLKMGFFSLLDSVRATFAQTFGTSHLAMQESLRRADVMSEPIRAKSSEFKRGYNFSYGFSCMQGWRRGMEDDHTMTIDPDEKTAFFGVFDGHCGQTVATYCGKHLFTFVKNASKYSALDFPHALKEGFTALDKHIFKTLRGERSGCTAVTLLMKTNDQGVCKLYCANAGDSRCIISRDGAAHPLSEDHKPDLPKEHQRIQNAGGFVARSRVNGSLALSRAIGDFSFKTNSTISWEEQAVTSDPDVTEWEIKPTDEFIVLACDGIWDVKTNDEVITFVRDRLKRNIPLDKICEEIMEDCLAPTPFGLGCDNMSVIIITLNGNGTVDRYRDPSLKKPEIKAVETPAAEPLKVEVETAEVKEEALEVEEETPATPVSDSPEIMSPSTVQATTAFPTGNSSADDEDDGMVLMNCESSDDSGTVTPYSIVDNDVVVIKIGSNSLLGADGKSLDEEYMKKIADQVSVLMKDHGKKVVLVSSGACAVGVQVMGLSEKPTSVVERQALCAIGQIHVITKWERAFAPHKLLCSQLMLTHHDFNIRSSCKNLIATLSMLLQWGIIPIVNENDPVATFELTVGDNDRLAALLSSQVAAKHLLLLTDINGLYDADPRFNPEAKKLDIIEAVTKTMLNAAGGPGAKGRGGMRSKLESARFAAACGVCAIIAHSREEQVVLRTILDDNAQIGTKILPVPWDQPADDAVNERRRWIACKRTTGVVTVDQAGEDHFMARGDINTDHIVEHEGTFGVGDTVEVRDASGHEIGRALSSIQSTRIKDSPQCIALSSQDYFILECPIRCK